MRFWLTLIIASGILFSTPGVVGAQSRPAAAPKSPAKQTTVESYLWEVGNTFDVYFSLELLLPDLKDVPPLDLKEVTYRPTATIEDALGALAKQVPELVAARDRDNPSVFHLTDKRLSALPDYALELPVTLEMDGTPYELLNRLSRAVPRISYQRLFSGSIEAAAIDAVTHVHLKVSQVKIRKILTEAVPLKGYSHVVWVAQTEKHNRETRTEVRFNGPALRLKHSAPVTTRAADEK